MLIESEHTKVSYTPQPVGILDKGQGDNNFHKVFLDVAKAYQLALRWKISGEDNKKYILANATGPTSHYFEKNFRNYLWIDDVILIIDDARTYEYGNYAQLFHPEGDSYKRGIDINVINKNAAINIRPLWPEYLTENDFEHDWPDNLKIEEHEGPVAKLIGTDNATPYNSMEKYYSINTPNKSKDIKFITAIVLKKSPESDDYPDVIRINEQNDMLGIRISHQGKVTDVYVNKKADGRLMHINSSTTINGHETDAYILAYSYDEGVQNPNPSQIKEWFIAYGSYLRNDDQVIFNSNDKKTIVVKD